MSAGILDQLIQQAITGELGLPESLKLPFVIDCIEGEVEVRLPAPSNSFLDYRPDSETSDIVGKGETVDEALKDACVSYRISASKTTLSVNFSADRKPLMQ